MKNESSNLNEDKQDSFENKFELIDIAARRARKLREGKKRLIECDSQKESVIALKEIISGRIKFEITRKNDGRVSED